VGVPFLNDGSAARRRWLIRSSKIANEVYEYLVFIADKLAPYASLSPEKLRKISLPEPPEKPQTLGALEQVETFGLPNAGTWHDQPISFMRDVEAAKSGRARFDRRQVSEAKIEMSQAASNVVPREML